MIIKISKVISCSSEHPSYPASNLLEYHSNRSWRCAKPGEMLASVIFQISEPSCITGIDIGNYRSCVVIVDASTSADPDKWVPIVNHRFLTNDEAANNKFRDQVQIFTKKELNPETLKVKFDRIKVTCMQSANPRELFGLTFITFRTEVQVDLGLDVFGRFKLKETVEENKPTTFNSFKEKYSKLLDNNKPMNYKDELKAKVRESSSQEFAKRQEEVRESPKRPLLQKLEEGKVDEVFGKKEAKVKDQLNTSNNANKCKKDNDNNNSQSKNKEKVDYTPFGDPVPKKEKKKIEKNDHTGNSSKEKNGISKKHSLDESEEEKVLKKVKCNECSKCSKDKLCKDCGLLYPEKEDEEEEKKKKKDKKDKKKRPKKPFNKLFEGISFSLSGYVNPERDSIRRKALQMGAKYIADPNTTNNKCTHLICAFKNTPKYQQLKNCSKIVSHTFIEDCFDKKIRFPWRRYALDKSDKNQPDSEEEVEAASTDPYEMDTDADSDY